MSQVLHISPEVEADFVSNVTELIRATSQKIILSTGGFILIWQLIGAVFLPAELVVKGWLITLVISPFFIIAYKLNSNQTLVAAQVIWQLGLAMGVLLAIYLFEQPEFAFLYALFPLIAAITIGWPAGLVAEGIVIILVWWLTNTILISPLRPA